MGDAAKTLIESGVLGAVSIIALLACWRLYRDRQEAEKRHAADLAAVRDRLVTKAESWMAKYYELADAFREAAISLRKDLSDGE